MDGINSNKTIQSPAKKKLYHKTFRERLSAARNTKEPEYKIEIMIFRTESAFFLLIPFHNDLSNTCSLAE